MAHQNGRFDVHISEPSDWRPDCSATAKVPNDLIYMVPRKLYLRETITMRPDQDC